MKLYKLIKINSTLNFLQLVTILTYLRGLGKMNY